MIIWQQSGESVFLNHLRCNQQKHGRKKLLCGCESLRIVVAYVGVAFICPSTLPPSDQWA